MIRKRFPWRFLGRRKAGARQHGHSVGSRPLALCPQVASFRASFAAPWTIPLQGTGSGLADWRGTGAAGQRHVGSLQLSPPSPPLRCE